MVNVVLASLLLSSAVAGSLAAQHANNTLTSCSYTATCTVSGVEGVCVDVSAG